MTPKRATAPALALLAALALPGCAEMSRGERNVGTGALGGAALGGLVGSFSGDLGWGALIGGGLGAGAGYLYEQSQRSQDRAYQDGRRQGYQGRQGYQHRQGYQDRRR